jgi:hypothetical protein
VFLVSYVLLWVLVAVLFAGVFALYHHFGQMYLTSRGGRAEQGPAEGAFFLPIEGAVIGGDSVVIPHAERAALVVFASTSCPLCGKLRAGMVRAARSHPEVDLIVACAGPPRMVRAWSSDMDGAVQVIADPRGRIASRYRVGALPFAIAVGNDGKVRWRGLVNDDDGLDMAIQDATALTLTDISANGRSVRQ